MSPNDAALAKKIGQALVRTHQYEKASDLDFFLLLLIFFFCECSLCLTFIQFL